MYVNDVLYYDNIFSEATAFQIANDGKPFKGTELVQFMG